MNNFVPFITGWILGILFTLVAVAIWGAKEINKKKKKSIFTALREEEERFKGDIHIGVSDNMVVDFAKKKPIRLYSENERKYWEDYYTQRGVTFTVKEGDDKTYVIPDAPEQVSLNDEEVKL